MEYCLQAVYNSVTKDAGRRERAVAVGEDEDEDEVYLEKRERHDVETRSPCGARSAISA